MDILALACALVAAAIYYNTLYAGFVYDDRRAILTNADLKPSTPWSKLLENDFWGTPLRERGSHGSYRPLCVATYRLNYLLGGLEPFGYHLVNVFLHAICTALVVKIAKKVLPGQTLAQAISGLLFAVHPIHSEAVAGIVGRADLLACLFAEGAFLSYVAHYERSRPIFHLLLTILLSISATLAKETGISSLALCLLWDFCHSETLRRKMKNRWPSSTIVAGSLAIITLGRLRVGGGRAPEFASADNPVARHPSRLTRGLTFLYLPAASLSMLLCPCSLSFDWSMNAVPVINSITDPRNLLSILLYGSLLPAIIWALRKLKKPSCYNSPYPSYRHRTKSSLEQLSSYTSLSSISGCPSSSLTSTAYFLSSSLSPLSSSLSSASSSAAAAAAASSSSCTSSSSSSLSSSLTGGASRCPVCAGRRINTYHTDNCRAANNNNGPVAECHCPKKKHKLLNNNRLLTATSSSSSSSSSNYNKLMPTSLLTIIGFLVFPFLPASNIFFYVGFVIAERILYLPSIGACLAIGAAIATSYNKARRKGSKRISRTILILTTILLTCMSARTLMRNVDWYNEENLYRSALRINPPKAYGNLGSVLSAQGRVDEAEEAFLEALRHRPNMADVHYNLGILQQGRRNYDEAILSYQRAIHFRPSLAQAYVNLGATLISVDRGTEAIAVLRAAASLDGSALKDKKAHEAARVQALLHLGSLYAEQGRLHKALSSYREALRMLPEHYPPQGVYNLLGETLSRLQQYNEAEKWFQASLASQPDHVPAHITYGKLLARNSSRVLEAERWFLRARRLAPQDPSVHHHYGLFLSSQGRLEEAASAHLEAASLGRMDYELAVAAASALRRASRCEEAELWYRHALGLRPSEARSHANLGAILHLNGKYKQAAAAYREALRLQPGDATTITNLHKLAALLV